MEGVFSSQVWNCEQEWFPGEYIQIKAPSGKGKTSFIRFLTGQSLNYGGEIFWNAKENRDQNPEDWSVLRSEIFTIIPQNLDLLESLGVEKNILLRVLLQNKQGEARAWKEDLHQLGLSVEHLQKPINILSQGEKQRISILRALQGPFKWLVLDEPFSHLDTKTSEHAWSMISQVAKVNGAGIILTTLDGGPGHPDQVLEL